MGVQGIAKRSRSGRFERLTFPKPPAWPGEELLEIKRRHLTIKDIEALEEFTEVYL